MAKRSPRDRMKSQRTLQGQQMRAMQERLAQQPKPEKKSSFNVAEIEDLTFDFRPKVDLHGTLNEPTGTEIKTYRKALVTAFKEAGALGTDEDDDVVVDMAQLEVALDTMDGIEDTLVAATADLVHIPAETLNQLNYRQLRAFLGWIMGTFFDPEG